MPSTGRFTDSVGGSATRSPRLSSGIEMGAVAGLLNDRQCAIHRRWILVRRDAGRSHTNFLHVQTFASQRLAHPSNTRPAMHSVNMQCEFRHNSPVCIDDSREVKMQAGLRVAKRVWGDMKAGEAYGAV